jgi:hypothetical protein
MLEKAVTWVIILIVIVFDPLAVIMLLAAQMTFAWHRKDGNDPLAETPAYEPDDGALTDEQIAQINMLADEARVPSETIIPHTTLFVDNGEHPKDTYEHEKETHTEEVPSETPLTALGGDITAPEEPTEDPVESELEKWNKMIEEAEAEALKEREARKYHILPELQKELGKQGPEFPANPEEGQEFTRSDMTPPRTFAYNGSQWVDIETYDRIKPDLTEVIEPETDAKKKTYMTKDQAGKIQIKNRS